MNELADYPRPWRVTTTSRARKTGGGYNYHIRAANDYFVAEHVNGDAAQRIVEAVNERDQLRQAFGLLTTLAPDLVIDADNPLGMAQEIERTVRIKLTAATTRAEAAEARVKHLDDMLEMLPEYLEYWDADDGPTLSLSEWYMYRDGYQE